MNISINVSQEVVIKEAMDLYMSHLVGKGKKYNSCVEVLNKIAASGLIPDTRTSKIFVNKQYLFGFTVGGWNTVWAKTKRGAIAIANKEYKTSSLIPDPNTFHIATADNLKSAMSLFY